MSQPATNASEVETRPGLFRQLQGLDNRYWIVNVMEMFERLAYYGVRAVVAIYMVLPREKGGPQFTHTEKGYIFAWWAAVQSLLPMFTGGFADRYGHKRTISFAIVLKIIGYVVMAHQMSFWGFFFGCILLAAGTAIFKPGVQGTLAATLKSSNASIGWGVFYLLVNIGGFLGPILAGFLRLLAWKYVFYACAVIVAINFLWLPFYQDPTQEAEFNADTDSGRLAWGELSRTLSARLTDVWAAIFGVLTFVFGVLYATGRLGATAAIVCLGFSAIFVQYRSFKTSYDEGRDDPLSVLILSVVGLFRHRVFFFCVVFAGFWVMFNQVFDLLPNYIDDWVNSSGIIATLGKAFSTPTVPAILASVLGLIYGGVCAVGVLLALRPDQRNTKDVPPQSYLVVALALFGAFYFTLQQSLPSSVTFMKTALPTPLLIAGALSLLVAAAAFVLRPDAQTIAIPTFLLGAIGAIIALYTQLMGSAGTLTKLAAEGKQVNPEWMINLNPGLIVFTMVFFAYLSSFFRPLVSIIIGMIVATAGSVIAGTAVIGWICLAGIFVFSVGEMLSSPKKMEYLATLSPKGQEGLFMGYANVPVAIGWIAGSIFAGNRYELVGDKVNLAKMHMIKVLGMAESAVNGLKKSEVLPTLAAKLKLTALQTQELLFKTYHPERVWIDIAIIGVVSIIGMIIYDRVLSAYDKRQSTSSAG